MTAALEVLIADESPVLRRVLRVLLELTADILVVDDAASLGNAVERCDALRPAVLLVDGDLIQRAGETPATLHRRLPDTGLLVLSLYPDPRATRPISGAAPVAMLAKDCAADQLAATVRALAARARPAGGHREPEEHAGGALDGAT